MNVSSFLGKCIDNKPSHFLLLKCSRINAVRRNGTFDMFVKKTFAAVRPKADIQAASSLLTPSEINDALTTLNKDGVAILKNSLSKNDLQQIMAFISETPAYASNVQEKIAINPANVPRQHSRYFWRMNSLIKNKAIQNIFTDPTFHRIAQEYIGCSPLLTDVTLWLSPVYGEVTYDHIFHCDNDSPTFLKFFIYLTDTDELSGAHAYIKGTNHPEKRKNLTVGKRYTDEQIISMFGKENLAIMSAPAGTIIAEDTSGLHRGTAPKERHRFMLQLRFSNIDTFQREKQEKITKVTIPNLDPQLRKNLRIICN